MSKQAQVEKIKRQMTQLRIQLIQLEVKEQQQQGYVYKIDDKKRTIQNDQKNRKRNMIQKLALLERKMEQLRGVKVSGGHKVI